MDISTYFQTLASATNPLLPNATAMRVALYVMWAVVLGSGTLQLAGKLSRPYRLGLALLVMALTLVPGESSPAYWLGLSFQAPSMMSGLICFSWAFGQGQQGATQRAAGGGDPRHTLRILSLLGIVLGWVLLLDTLAWFPFSVYAWGFDSVAVAVLVVLAALGWLTEARTRTSGSAPGLKGSLVLCVLVLFICTRLPTGNVWDALIDPWLWVALQVGWLVSAARRLKRRKLAAPTTHA